MVMRFFLMVICVFSAGSNLVIADEQSASPGTNQQSVEDFLRLLEGLQDDPASRASVEEVVRQRLEAAKEGVTKVAPEVEDAASKVTAAEKRQSELDAQIGDLTKQVEAAKAELEQVRGTLPELTKQLEAAQQEKASIDEKLSIYERSLELLDLLDSESAPTSKPIEQAQPAPDAVPAVDAADRVDFNKDIRPILANNCFACHGPDEKTRKAKLRLDTEAGATAVFANGGAPIVPGDSAASEMFRRISTSDPTDKMPPAEFEKTLSEEQIALIGKWINQGGRYQTHWAFVTPEEPALPQVSNQDWVKNEIDYFILAKLEREGLSPSPEADRQRLIRRVTLDLTGLPPTPEEVDAFVVDESPDAYEKVVDRLLESPHYGEQMARQWLDVARYADTNGYHIDNVRYMWRWRDWVIDAYNRNLPFDEFTIEQLAGDLLPEPRLDQLIATGFNRNHMITFEGGIIPEEYRVQYVIDRLNTTGSVWMGLTVGCAQCHDHKFDPISSKEFYEMFAFFNSVPEQGSDGRDGNAVPRIPAPLPDQKKELDALKSNIDAVLAKMRVPVPEIDDAQKVWEAEATTRLQSRWSALDAETAVSTGGATLKKRVDRSILVEGENPEKDVYEIVANTNLTGITALRLETLTDPSLPKGGLGRSENSNFVLTEFKAEISPIDNAELKQAVTFSIAAADYEQKDFDARKAIDGDAGTGWAVSGGETADQSIVFIADRPFGFDVGTRIHISMHHESAFPQHAIGSFRISTSSDPSMAPAQFGPWHVNGPYLAENGKTAYETDYGPETHVDLTETYDDHRAKWVARPDLADGTIQELSGDVCATYFYRTITSPSTRDMVLKLGSNDANKLWVNGEVAFDNNVQRGVEAEQDTVKVRLKAGENQILMKVVNYGNAYAYYFRQDSQDVGEFPREIERALAVPSDTREEQHVAALRDYYRSLNWPDWKPLEMELAALRESEKALEAEIPTTMVMAELEAPRDTFILARGQYDQPTTEKVTPAVPAALPPLPEDAPNNRLGFAKWLVDPSHPLTSRVVVNRYWMHYFGAGIVRTAEDFGIQGEWPSHLELLDWLATEFIDSGWDTKAMQKKIVMSATYRQASMFRDELLERDPENRLLAKGPRFRMDAEMVRDNALAISGLLVDDIGGPSVKPYQPGDLWKEVSYGGDEFTGQVFVQDTGENLYRRSMYTFWKRQSPPPGMLIFDAPNREVCTVRRARTNTPLQALALMNDTQYVEASRVLAERMMKEAGPEPMERVMYAFELATAREPKPEECAVLVETFHEQVEAYRQDQEAAASLLAVGEQPRDESLDISELAAWSTVASIILNLDETVTKS
jgi:mono/diheme cytochrome c family protein